MREKTKAKTRDGTREESMKFAAEVSALDYPGAKKDAQCLALKDGNMDAVRVRISLDTGEVVRNSNGWVKISYPWILSDVFSIKVKR